MNTKQILRFASCYLTAVAALKPDHIDLFEELNRFEVKYVVIGGQSMDRLGLRSSSGDVDIFVDKSPENSERIFMALASFGYPVNVLGITRTTFSDEDGPAMNAALPGHVEIISNIKEIPMSFDQALSFSEPDEIEGVRINWLSPQGLANMKGHPGTEERRHKDITDLELLKELGIEPEELSLS